VEQISHAQFWHRYLFRKGLIEDEEAARERKEEREKQVAESFQWDKGKHALGLNCIKLFYCGSAL
jgi:hypothetical protein